MKLFLGGISPNTPSDVVKQHFSKFGPVADAVVMRDRGFGFVTFESREGGEAALQETPQTIDGQTVDVKEANSKGGPGGGRSDRGGGARGGGAPDDSGITTDKIFVGGLPQDCSDDKIRRYFETYGTIVDAVVMQDRETGRSRGFGFIQFDNPSPVDDVMADYAVHKIEGKWVEVKRSIPRDRMPPPGRDGGRGGGRDGGRGGDRGRDSRDGGKGGGAGAYPGYPGYPPYGGGAYVGGYGAFPGYGGYPGYPGYGYPGYGMPPPGYGGYPMDPYGGAYPGYPPQQALPPPQGAPPPRERSRERRDRRSSPY